MSDTFRSGLLYGLVAYVCWGLVPLYFRQIKSVPAAEILAHRIVWSVLVLGLLTVALGTWRDLLRVLSNRKLVLTLLLSATLLAMNWLMYIYASITNRVAEASLGYYMMPLVNAFFATLILKEKLRPAHYPALALVAGGVAAPFIVEGDFTWLAVALPITFGFYALVRKTVPVESLTGLTVESLLMFLPSIGFLGYLAVVGELQFGPDPSMNALLAFSGLVTVVPLLTFSISIRRLPLLANSMIQFISPTVQFLLAIYINGETVEPARWIAIICVWLAVVLFMGDAVWQAYGQSGQAKKASTPDRIPGTLPAVDPA